MSNVIVQQITICDGYTLSGSFVVLPGDVDVPFGDSYPVAYYLLRDYESITVYDGTVRRVTNLGNGHVTIGPRWRPRWICRLFGSGTKIVAVQAASE